MIELGVLVAVFIACNIFLSRIADKEDPAPTYFFGNMFFTSTLLMVTTLILFKTGEERCAKVVEIGGCNKSSCGVRMSNGAIERMGAPVIGEELCRHDIVPRFRNYER